MCLYKTSIPPRNQASPSEFVYFWTNQIRSSNRISQPASSHEIFLQFSKSFANFFRFLFVFWTIFMRILFIDCPSFLCAISFEVLCRFSGKNLALNLLYVSICLKEFHPFSNIMYIYVVQYMHYARLHCLYKIHLYLYTTTLSK